MRSPTNGNAENTTQPFSKTVKMLRDQSGSALMIALFTVTLLMVVAMEIVYESNVEFLVSSSQVNRIKAYYAAKSGVEISLLRIHIYKKALAAFGNSIPDKTMFDLIWTTPFAWPPPIPDDLNAVDKDSIKQAVKNSSMKSSYTANIMSEGSKIDLNDLGSPSEKIREATRKLVLQVFQSRLETDDAWSREYRSFNFESLVNNIADWVDADQESLNGGAENRYYRDFGTAEMPPNRVFQSVNELHLVGEMNDQIFEVLAPRVTVFGSKAVNVNHASKQVLMALHDSITSEVADKIIESRNDPNRGPFKDMNDFLQFVQPLGVPQSAFVENDEPVIPLAFDPEFNFRIEAIGIAGKVNRKITAIVYDFDRAKTVLADQIRKENAKKNPTPPPGGPPPTGDAPPANPTPSPTPQQTQIKAPTERPNVVYWIEE